MKKIRKKSDSLADSDSSEQTSGKVDECANETDDEDAENLIHETANTGSLSLTNLKLVLHEFNFYERIAQILTSFYPYDTYSLKDLKRQQQQQQRSTSISHHSISICSPTLVSSICQLLINLCVLLKSEALTSLSESGIIKLLISYVKPINTNSDIINMLQQICSFLNVYYLNQSKVSDAKENNVLVYDLISCLNLNLSSSSFNASLFDLLSTLLVASSHETFLIIVSKCWLNLAKYLLNHLLNEEATETDEQSQVSGLLFFSIYLSKLSRSSMSKNVQIIAENMSYLLDRREESADAKSLTQGEEICSKLIKKFDKLFLSSSSSSTSASTQIVNLLKCVFSLSSTAKRYALQNGLVETLIEHLKYTHSKLNLRSLQSNGR